MNFRTLQYICAVADFGHFGKAATFCNVSQPALSEQIKKYEARIGISIFDRDTRQVRVTRTGERVILLAREALSAIAEIETVAETSKDPLSGNLRIGMIPTIAPYLIPRLAPRLLKALPRVTIQYCEDITDGLVTSLGRGDLDILVVSTLPGGKPFKTTPLYREDFLLALNKAHILASRKNVKVADIASDDLLLLNEGHCLRGQLMEITGLVSGKKPPALWATNIETLINMVVAQQGVTLVPALAALSNSLSYRDVLYKSVSDKRAARDIQLVYGTGFHKRDQLAVIKSAIAACLQKTGLTLLP